MDQQYPEPTVGAFIFNPQGEILLVQSHKWHGKWVVPGGHVELGETLEDALRREALEETGLAVSNLELINFQQFIYDDAFWKRRHFIFFDFACQTGQTDVRLNDEAQAHVWVNPSDALAMDVDRYTRTSIEIWLQKNTAA